MNYNKDDIIESGSVFLCFHLILAHQLILKEDIVCSLWLYGFLIAGGMSMKKAKLMKCQS